MTNNSMVLSIVFLAVVVGLCINALGEKILILKNLLIDINNIISVFLGFIITKFSPFAVFVLITRAYPVFVYLNTKLNPIIFMKKIAKVALLGFSAAASSAALSLNEKTTVEELGVNKDIASFVLPLGMTINMNGTAIMQVIAAIFIAASSGYSLTIQNVILIAVLAFCTWFIINNTFYSINRYGI